MATSPEEEAPVAPMRRDRFKLGQLGYFLAMRGTDEVARVIAEHEHAALRDEREWDENGTDMSDCCSARSSLSELDLREDAPLGTVAAAVSPPASPSAPPRAAASPGRDNDGAGSSDPLCGAPPACAGQSNAPCAQVPNLAMMAAEAPREACEADSPDPEVAPLGRAPLESEEEQETLPRASGNGADDANLTDECPAAGRAATVVTVPKIDLAPAAAPPPMATVTVTGANESPVVLTDDVSEGAVCPAPFDEATNAAAAAETAGTTAAETKPQSISISTNINVKETVAREGPRRDDATEAPLPKPLAADAPPAAAAGAPHAATAKVKAPLSSAAPRQLQTMAVSMEREPTAAVPPPSARAAVATRSRESKPAGAAQVPNLAMAAAPREACETDGPIPEIAPLIHAPLELEEPLLRPSRNGANDANRTDGDECPAAGGAATVVTVPTTNLAQAAAPPPMATVTVPRLDGSPVVLADATEGAASPAPLDEATIAAATAAAAAPASISISTNINTKETAERERPPPLKPPAAPPPRPSPPRRRSRPIPARPDRANGNRPPSEISWRQSTPSPPARGESKGLLAHVTSVVTSPPVAHRRRHRTLRQRRPLSSSSSSRWRRCGSRPRRRLC